MYRAAQLGDFQKHHCTEKRPSRYAVNLLRFLPMIVWIVGLSGSGKSTVARALRDRWPSHRGRLLLVDGDDVRAAFGGAGRVEEHSIAGRRANAERVLGIVRLLDTQDVDIVVATLSLFPDLLRENRRVFTNYLEIYLKASLSLVRRRDPRGLYAARDAGRVSNIVGVDIEFPEPDMPDMVVNMDEERSSPSEIADRIITRVTQRPSGSVNRDQ